VGVIVGIVVDIVDGDVVVIDVMKLVIEVGEKIVETDDDVVAIAVGLDGTILAVELDEVNFGSKVAVIDMMGLVLLTMVFVVGAVLELVTLTELIVFVILELDGGDVDELVLVEDVIIVVFGFVVLLVALVWIFEVEVTVIAEVIFVPIVAGVAAELVEAAIVAVVGDVEVLTEPAGLDVEVELLELAAVDTIVIDLNVFVGEVVLVDIVVGDCVLVLVVVKV
jgi:hypothetical protein